MLRRAGWLRARDLKCWALVTKEAGGMLAPRAALLSLGCREDTSDVCSAVVLSTQTYAHARAHCKQLPTSDPGAQSSLKELI